MFLIIFFFSSRRRHTRCGRDWSSDVCSSDLKENTAIQTKEVRLYFDPVSQMGFKSSVKSGIDKMVSKIETESIYNAFLEELGEDGDEVIFETDNFITFTEILPVQNNKE